MSTHQPLAGRTAIVTGGSTLVGQGTVRALHEHGADVVVVDIDAKGAQPLVDELGVRLVVTDITDDQALAEKFPYMPQLKAALESAKPRPVTPFYPKISKGIADNVFAALTQGKSIDDTVADISTVITNAGS